MPIGVFPGSFDPLTTAHLAIADAAIAACGLDQLHLALSPVALGKDHGGHTTVEHRVEAIARTTRSRPRVGVRVTDDRLIADIADGYDICVIGADKWHQLHDPAFYDGSVDARDDALARLPTLAIAPRVGFAAPSPGPSIVLLDLDPAHGEVSSTAVRGGRDDWRAQ